MPPRHSYERLSTFLAPTDAVLFQFGALLDLAEVQRSGWSRLGRASTLADASALAEIKGSGVMVGAVEAILSRRRPLSPCSPSAPADVACLLVR